MWVFAGGSDPEQKLGTAMEMGKAMEKEGPHWMAELLEDLQERAGSCAEQGKRGDYVSPWGQRIAGGHLVVL